MYGMVSLISLIIRQFFLPNPYINCFSNKNVADLFNLIIGGAILHFLSFIITSIYYSKGDAPTIGSITLIGNLIDNIYLLIFSLTTIYLIIISIVIKISKKTNF